MTAETDELKEEVARLASRQKAIIRNQRTLTKSLKETQAALEALVRHLQTKESNDNHDN